MKKKHKFGDTFLQRAAPAARKVRDFTAGALSLGTIPIAKGIYNSVKNSKHNFAAQAQAREAEMSYKKHKKKLGLKHKTKPGDLLSAFKKQTVKKGNWYAETDLDNKTIKINKAKHKSKPLHKKRYPELADTIYHETLHAKYPNMTEKEAYKKTHRAMKTMGPKQKSRLYSMFK